MKQTRWIRMCIAVIVWGAMTVISCNSSEPDEPVSDIVRVSGISLSSHSLSLEEGKTATLTATVTPENATNKTILWTSSNATVATVKDGIVTAIKAGSAEVAAITEDGGKKAICSISVTAIAEPSVTVGAEKVSAVSAVLMGKANIGSVVGSDIEMGILYSTSSGVIASNSTKIKATNMDGSYNYSVVATVLNPSTTYYYRSFITQYGQDTYGEVKEFSTKSVETLIQTRDATSVEAASATLTASLNLEDVYYDDLEYGFYWGTSDSELNGHLKGGSISDNAFCASLTYLSHQTQYYYKSYVRLNNQSFDGGVRTFITGTIPVESVSLDIENYTFSYIGIESWDLQLTANVLPVDATNKNVEWTSSDNSVASVSSCGVVKAVDNGTAVITVTTKDQGKTASCVITVAQVMTDFILDKELLELNEGESSQLSVISVSPDNAYDKSVSWHSSDTSVATVDENGIVTGISKGSAIITATANDGSGCWRSCSVVVKRLVSSIILDKTSISVYNGKTEVITATVSPSTADDPGVIWSSANTSIATVSADGVVTGIARGVTSIIATSSDASDVQATCEVEVKQFVTSLSLNETVISLSEGENRALTATVLPENANDRSFTWTSSDESVATIDANGIVRAVSLSGGSVVITATANDGSGVSASCRVGVLGAVDLGLSVKWSNYNLGASYPEEYGEYYAWGEIEPKSIYDWSTYKWCNGSNRTLTKYNSRSGNGVVDNMRELDPEDDAAHNLLGGNWRIPTPKEIDELLGNCTAKWAIINGVSGYILTSNVVGYKDKWIFLPAAGYKVASSLYNAGSYGIFWSSMVCGSCTYSAYYLYFNSSSILRYYNYYTYDENGHDRSRGFPIRPVTE